MKEDKSTGCTSGPTLHGSLVPSALSPVCLCSCLGWHWCWQVDGCPAGNPGQPNRWISQLAGANVQGDGSPWRIHSAILSAHSQSVCYLNTPGTRFCPLYLLKYTEVTKVDLWCKWRENLLSRILFKTRCWKSLFLFCLHRACTSSAGQSGDPSLFG